MIHRKLVALQKVISNSNLKLEIGTDDNNLNMVDEEELDDGEDEVTVSQ